MQRAQALSQTSAPIAARSLCLDVLKTDPVSLQALALLTSLIETEPHLNQAIAAAETANAQTTQDTSLRLMLVNLLIEGQRFDRVANLLDRLRADMPGKPIVWSLSGRLAAAKGEAEEAARFYLRAACLSPKDRELWEDFSSAFRDVVLSEEQPDLVAAIARCLAIDGIDTKFANIAACNFLKQRLRSVYIQRAEDSGPALRVLREWPNSEKFNLLIVYLRLGIISELFLEKYMTRLRQDLLDQITTSIATDAQTVPRATALTLVVAFAIQGLRSDFVFSQGDKETQQVENLADQIGTDFNHALDLDFLKIAAVAMYQPLSLHPRAQQLLEACHTVGGPDAALLAQVHLEEPFEEEVIRSGIPSISQITDATSRAVRWQYEENPYPKWHRLPVRLKESPTSPPPAGRSLLIAGCGTGKQVIVAAMKTPSRAITAVDLSLSSLAYGIRKCREYGLSNVTFMQGDLLEFETWDRRFDDISCVGVLHHMKNPALGLRALKFAMARGHGLKVGVYTESGRQNVVAGIALRENLGLSTSPSDMRRLRKIVADLTDDHPAKSMMGWRDFYSLSEWRDLVFHVQEHRFTVQTFGKIAREAGLGIKRMNIPHKALTAFKQAYPEANPGSDIAKWHTVEMNNPGIFGPMYNFHLTKL